MTDNGATDKHHVVLTEGQYKALDRLTSGDPEYQTDLLKCLRKQLDHKLFQARGRRYHVDFTSQDLESAAYVLLVDSLQNGQRHRNRLLRNYGHLIEWTR